MKRLNIVVPYRAREMHLRIFVQALRNYFARDKIDRDIPYRVTIVEQESGLPFNRGALKNIGFILGRGESDYTCFHDVDYLPIWADYSWSEFPTPIVWYGAERRPIAPGRNAGMADHDMDEFFGAAVLFPNAMFERVNGYANAYFGWGFEDTDLKNRLTLARIPTGRRRGTFQPLDHDNEGYQLDGSVKMSKAALANEGIFNERWRALDANHRLDDGIQSVAYKVLNRARIPEGPIIERPAIWEAVTVRLLFQPRLEQAEAAVELTMTFNQAPR
jgi:hypothetical protein